MSPSTKSFGQGSSPVSKRPMFEKRSSLLALPAPIKEAPTKNDEEPTPECKHCFGPHDASLCKWTPEACFSYGQVGHRSSKSAKTQS